VQAQLARELTTATVLESLEDGDKPLPIEHPRARSAKRSAKLLGKIQILSYTHQVMKETAKNVPEIESVQRIEPARLEEVPEAISDAVAVVGSIGKAGSLATPAHCNEPFRNRAHHEHLLQQPHRGA
jgi:hypothetical protein